MTDQVDQLLHLIEQLRGALSGRTMSCELCNDTAQKQDLLIEQMASISAANAKHVQQREQLLEAVRQFVQAELHYGKRFFSKKTDSRWLDAWMNLRALVADE